MKKVFPLLCAATIVSSSFAVHAQADEQQTVETVESEGEMIQEKNSLEEVKELTLEDAIKRGTEVNTNIKILQFNLEIAKNQLLKIKNDPKMTGQDIKKAEDHIDSLNGEMENLKEGLRLTLTSSYMNMLLLQEEMDFTKKSLQSAINEVDKTQRLYNLGRLMKEALSQAEIARDNTEKQLKEQEKNYNRLLAAFSSDIGIAYNPNTVIKSIRFEALDFETPTNFTLLIEQSYKMKKAQKSLESVMLNRDNVYKDYENGKDNVTIYDKAQQDYQVKIAEEMMASTQVSIEAAIKQLYDKAESSYSSYEEAVQQLEAKRKEMDGLQIRYNLGRISKYDYEKAQLGLAAAELNVYKAKVQNYTIQQSIAALQKGYI
ncbi:outer membrane protein TolC [Bacillus fengqiuensis]|nr:outer membrane protein TolC [Bacillus fengqiuensis]